MCFSKGTAPHSHSERVRRDVAADIITPDVLPAEWPIVILAAVVMAADCPSNILTLRFRPRSGRSAISFGVNLERP